MYQIHHLAVVRIHGCRVSPNHRSYVQKQKCTLPYMHRSQSHSGDLFLFPLQFCLSNNQPCILHQLSLFHRTHRYTPSNWIWTAHITSLRGREYVAVNSPSLLSGLTVTWRLFHTEGQPHNIAIAPFIPLFFPLPISSSFFTALLQHCNIHSYHRHFTALFILLPLVTRYPGIPFLPRFPLPHPMLSLHATRIER